MSAIPSVYTDHVTIFTVQHSCRILIFSPALVKLKLFVKPGAPAVWHRGEAAVCYRELAESHSRSLAAAAAVTTVSLLSRSSSQCSCYTSHPLIKLSDAIKNRHQRTQWTWSAALCSCLLVVEIIFFLMNAIHKKFRTKHNNFLYSAVRHLLHVFRFTLLVILYVSCCNKFKALQLTHYISSICHGLH